MGPMVLHPPSLASAHMPICPRPDFFRLTIISRHNRHVTPVRYASLLNVLWLLRQFYSRQASPSFNAPRDSRGAAVWQVHRQKMLTIPINPRSDAMLPASVSRAPTVSLFRSNVASRLRRGKRRRLVLSRKIRIGAMTITLRPMPTFSIFGSKATISLTGIV